MPDGTPKKQLDISKLSSLGWDHKISLTDSVRKTVDSYIREIGSGSVRQ